MVQFAPNGETRDAEEAAWVMLNSTGMPTLSFSTNQIPGDKNSPIVPKPIGTRLGGVVVSPPTTQHATDPKTKEPAYYKSGDPKIDIILELQTDERDDDDDDGIRRLYVRSQMLTAMKLEMKRLGIQRFGTGTQFWAELKGFKSNGPDMSPTKLFNVEIVPTVYVPAAEQAGQDAIANVVQGLGATEVQPAPQRQAPVQPAAAAAPDPAAVAAAIASLQASVSPVSRVTPEQVQMVDRLTKSANIPLDAALEAVAQTSGYPGDADFIQELKDSIPF